MRELERDGLDRLEAATDPVASAMPESLRALVRRRRRGWRARNAGGAMLVLVALVGGSALMLRSPTAPGRGQGPSTRLSPVLTIDDPMFDGLDGRGTMPKASVRWRAGSRLDGDWVLEM